MSRSTGRLVLGLEGEMKDLVKTWIAAQDVNVDSDDYARVSWAVDDLFDMAIYEPGKLLDTVVKILALDSSQKVTGALGAGVLEETLVHHGDAVIDQVVRLSENIPEFKGCIKYTFIEPADVSPEVYEKYSSLKQQV